MYGGYYGGYYNNPVVNTRVEREVIHNYPQQQQQQQPNVIVVNNKKNPKGGVDYMMVDPTDKGINLYLSLKMLAFFRRQTSHQSRSITS